MAGEQHDLEQANFLTKVVVHPVPESGLLSSTPPLRKGEFWLLPLDANANFSPSLFEPQPLKSPLTTATVVFVSIYIDFFLTSTRTLSLGSYAALVCRYVSACGLF